MDKELVNQLLSSKEFLDFKYQTTADIKYFNESEKVNDMLSNPTTKRENDIFEDYADISEDLNSIEDDNEYLRWCHDLDAKDDE